MSSTIRRTVISSLTAALLLAAGALPAAGQVEVQPTRNGIVVSADLTEDARRALEEGGGWDAVAEGLVVRYEGDGARTITGPLLRVMTMYPDGTTGESRTLAVSLEPGENRIQPEGLRDVLFNLGFDTADEPEVRRPEQPWTFPGHFHDWISRRVVRGAQPVIAPDGPPLDVQPDIDPPAGPLAGAADTGNNPFLVVTPDFKGLLSALADSPDGTTVNMPVALTPVIVVEPGTIR